jgi:hypothetical protein
MAPEYVDDLHALAHEQITGAEDHRARLALITLYRDKAHTGALHRLTKRLGICRMTRSGSEAEASKLSRVPSKANSVPPAGEPRPPRQ